MFYILHIPSNSPILSQTRGWDWHRKYIYFPTEEILSEYWVKKYYGTAMFESKTRTKVFLQRFDKHQRKEFIIVEVK
jgi:hypothetical protein